MTEQVIGANESLAIACRLNWSFLAAPYTSRKFPAQGPKYKTQGLLEPTSPEVQKIKDAQRRIAAAVWGANAGQMLGLLASRDELAIHDGNLSLDKDGNVDENAKGKLYIKASNKKQPRIVATIGNENVELAPGHAYYPYSGCKAMLYVELYVYEKKSFQMQLKGVQFLGHDKAFSGGGSRIAQIGEFGINPVDADAPIPAAQDVGSASGLF